MRRMPYYTYMLECTALTGKHRGKKTIYTGYTGCLTSRFDAHARGKGARYTRNKKIELTWTETFPTQAAAMAREREVKGFSAKKKRELIIAGQHAVLREMRGKFHEQAKSSSIREEETSRIVERGMKSWNI